MDVEQAKMRAPAELCRSNLQVHCANVRSLLRCRSVCRSSSTLAARVSRTQAGPQYLVSVAVLLTELLKLAACIVVSVFR